MKNVQEMHQFVSFTGNIFEEYKEFQQKWLPEFPNRPAKPIQIKNPTAVEARNYADAVSDYEIAYNEYQIKRIEYQAIDAAVNERIELGLKVYTGFFDVVPAQSQSKVWRKAWEDGHSNGWYEVYICLDNLIDLFR